MINTSLIVLLVHCIVNIANLSLIATVFSINEKFMCAFHKTTTLNKSTSLMTSWLFRNSWKISYFEKSFISLRNGSRQWQEEQQLLSSWQSLNVIYGNN